MLDTINSSNVLEESLTGNAPGVGYFKDTMGHGWRHCIRCGKKGIKDTFYGRNKEFCSIGCSRFAMNTRDYLFRNRNKLPYIKHSQSNPVIDLQNHLDKFEFAPVFAFHHVPLARCWRSIFQPDLYVEIIHESTGSEKIWLAKVLTHKGYFIKVQLVGKNKCYFLSPGVVNLFPIGYAAKHKKPYGVPYKNYNQEDLFKQMEVALLNCNTLTDDVFQSFQREIVNDYDRLMTFEVLDKTCPYQFVTGRVRSTYGDWVLIKYDLIDDFLWVHPLQGYFRPPGWCQLVGHVIRTTRSYATNSLLEFSRDLDIQTLFSKHLLLENNDANNRFKIGMKLEILDPFDHVMRVGTVEKILRLGFMMIRLDHDEKTLCFHVTSPYLYPPTFSDLNGIPIYDQNNYRFFWKTYEYQEGEIRAPAKLFPQKKYVCNFKEGMIIETFNLRAHGVVSYAIVLRVIGRILLIDFIHHSSNNGLLVDCESPCLYPVGFYSILQQRDKNIKFDYLPIEDFNANVYENLRLIKLNNEQTRAEGSEPMEVEHDIEMQSADRVEHNQPEEAPILPIEDDEIDPKFNENLTNINRIFRKLLSEKMEEEFVMGSQDSKLSKGKENEKTQGEEPLSETFRDICQNNSQVFYNKIPFGNLSTNVSDWSVDDVWSFLTRNHNLAQYADSFVEKKIDGKKLIQLADSIDSQTESEMVDLIKPFGDLLKFQMAVEKLKDQAALY